MGGYGSGRGIRLSRKPNRKLLVEQIPYLNSFKCMPNIIARKGLYCVTKKENIEIKISPEEFTITAFFTDSSTTTLGPFPMEKVKVGFGEKYYFSCPFCGTRTSRLYLYTKLACRKCLNLAYCSQNMSNEDRWFKKRDKLLERHNLGFHEAQWGTKPKHMHNRTFKKIIDEFSFLRQRAYLIHFNRHLYKSMLSELREARRNNFFL